MEEKKKLPILNVIIVILLSLSLGMNAFIGYMVWNKDKDDVPATAEVEKEEKLYSAKDISDMVLEAGDMGYNKGYEELKTTLKDKVSSGRGVNTAIREILDDYIFYIHDNEYIFKPINKELDLNSYKLKNFTVTDKDLPTYTIDYKDSKNGIEAFRGIDVSKFQGDIDWKSVAQSGIDFAFVRVGYRGYETGKLVEDENCKYNIENSLKNDIKTGVYFYTQAINEEEAVEEAEFVIDIVKEYDINYPIAFDLEVVGDAAARTNNLTTTERVDIVKAFCDTISNAGYTPMLYGNLATMFSMVEYEEVLDYEKWFAYYDIELYYPYDLAIWQYSCTGKVEGIEGDCDLNLAFKDLSTK